MKELYWEYMVGYFLSGRDLLHFLMTLITASVSFMFLHHIASLDMSDNIPHIEGNHSGGRVAELEKLP